MIKLGSLYKNISNQVQAATEEKTVCPKCNTPMTSVLLATKRKANFCNSCFICLVEKK